MLCLKYCIATRFMLVTASLSITGIPIILHENFDRSTYMEINGEIPWDAGRLAIGVVDKVRITFHVRKCIYGDRCTMAK